MVNWFRNGTQSPRRQFELWSDVLDIATGINFKIVDAFREGNIPADGLANLGSDGHDALFSSASELPQHLIEFYVLGKSAYI